MTQAASEAQGSPFWRFSLRLYRSPEVAEGCIRLQDEAGVDVNLLFFLLWNASLKRRFSSADVAAADGRIAFWRQSVVIPLRNIRRALKSTSGPIEPAACDAFRTKVKGLELEAERLQQQALYDFAQSATLGEQAPSTDEAARANIAAYEEFSSRRFPEPAVATVLAALAKR
jgi:uncharacterized protein (TIGR02444 family)